MRAPVSFGYLRPATERIDGGRWSVVTADGTAARDDGTLPGWDYFTPIKVERVLTIDVEGIRRDCALGPEARVRGVLAWHSTLTNIRGAVMADVEGANTISLRADLESTQLGGVLTLQVQLVVGVPSAGTSLLSPNRAASVLWAEETRIILEGEGQRFPMLPLDFAAAGVGGGRQSSGWCLEGTNAELSSSGTGSLRLLLNTSNPTIRTLLDTPEDLQSVVVQRFLLYDVYRQLVMCALHQDDLQDGMDWEAGTFGDLLATCVHRLFGPQRLDSLRGEYLEEPSEFEARLQAQLRFLDGAV